MLSTPTGVTAWLPVAQHSALVRLGQNLKRFPGEATKFDGSFQEFGFGTVIVRQWLDCDEDRVYFLNEKTCSSANRSRSACTTTMATKCGWQWEPLASAPIAGWAMGIHFQMGAYRQPEASR